MAHTICGLGIDIAKLVFHGAKRVTTSWLFAVFGGSHLAVLYRTDCLVRSPCSELPCPGSFSSKAVNFYPATRAYGVIGGRVTSSFKPCHQN